VKFKQFKRVAYKAYLPVLVLKRVNSFLFSYFCVEKIHTHVEKNKEKNEKKIKNGTA
jgi:hypothetical protein